MFYIRQQNDSDCGITCLKILLANVKKDKEYLFLPIDEEKGKYSFLDLKNIAKEHGLLLNGAKYSGELDISKIEKYPLIISIEQNEIKHSVILLKKKNDKILVLDPELGKRWFKFDDLNKLWDGYTLEVEDVVEDENYSPLFKNIIDKRLMIIIYGLQIISSLCLMFSFYFINETYDGLIYSSIFLLMYVLFSILFRININKGFQTISNNLLNRLENIPSNPLNFLERFENYKKHFFSNKISVVTNAITALFLILILLYNGKVNIFLIFAILAISFLNVLVFIPFLKEKSNSLKIDESRNLEKGEDFKKRVLSLEKKAYKYSQLKYLFDLTEGALILLTSFIITFSQGVLSTVSIVFYFLISRQLLLSINNVLSIDDATLELDNSKAKLANLYFRK